MSKMQACLKIELRSDLCAGSGYSYAGVIDSDVAYDDYGIPFVPARRLKGCMREAAELVCPSEAEVIFGKGGDDSVKGIVLGNACIENYHEFIKELRGLSNQTGGVKSYLTSQNILDMYTSIRAQTSIDSSTGTAKNNCLRFVRVVNQYNPLNPEENLCFYADIEYEDIWGEQIRRILKATRNMGMNRNRGLGSIRCTLINEKFLSGTKEKSLFREREGKACITYILYNKRPLLLSGDSNDVSDSYISGKSVLGRLAGEYLKQSGHDADSQEFRELFLDGTTIFTNANLTFAPKKGQEDASAWPTYYSAPLYLNKMKKSKVLVNQIRQDLSKDKSLPDKYHSENGNLPKKLKTQYVCEIAPNTYHVAEVERAIIFHNSQKAKKNKEDKLLYSAEVLKEGQYFKGKIYTDWKYVSMLTGLLEQPGLSFGKSKTAQYGTCELSEKVQVEEAKSDFIYAESGETIVITLCSDAIFQNEHGYTVIYDEVREIIAHDLSIPYKRGEDKGSIVQTKEITGYNTKWNLKKQAIPAIKAGSAFVYTIDKDFKWKQGDFPCFVGERNLEGYGEISISKYSRMHYMVESHKVSGEQDSIEIKICKPFLISIVTRKMLDELVYQYISKNHKKQGLKLSASTIGRVILMLKESLGECQGNPEKAFENFCTRIYFIKRANERKEAFDLLQGVLMKEGMPEKKYQIDIEKMLKAEKGSSLDEMKKVLENYCGEDYKRHVIELWGDYMNHILIYYKYLGKNKKTEKKVKN